MITIDQLLIRNYNIINHRIYADRQITSVDIPNLFEAYLKTTDQQKRQNVLMEAQKILVQQVSKLEKEIDKLNSYCEKHSGSGIYYNGHSILLCQSEYQNLPSKERNNLLEKHEKIIGDYLSDLYREFKKNKKNKQLIPSEQVNFLNEYLNWQFYSEYLYKKRRTVQIEYFFPYDGNDIGQFTKRLLDINTSITEFFNNLNSNNYTSTLSIKWMLFIYHFDYFFLTLLFKFDVYSTQAQFFHNKIQNLSEFNKEVIERASERTINSFKKCFELELNEELHEYFNLMKYFYLHQLNGDGLSKNEHGRQAFTTFYKHRLNENEWHSDENHIMEYRFKLTNHTISVPSYKLEIDYFLKVIRGLSQLTNCSSYSDLFGTLFDYEIFVEDEPTTDQNAASLFKQDLVRKYAFSQIREQFDPSYKRPKILQEYYEKYIANNEDCRGKGAVARVPY